MNLNPVSEAAWIAGAMLLFVAAVAAVTWLSRGRKRRTGQEQLDQAVASNLHIPQSLYPVINPDICIGSFSCLNACPEGDILGIVDERPLLVMPSHCIGHGKCAAECPVDAIRLVMGTSERGVDLPEVDEFFESSRPGVHVVGELGGMGLIKNAMTQGVQASKHLSTQLSRKRMAKAVDVAIVGSGPAGLATALGLQAGGLTFRILEQATFGGTIAQYPRQKVVMTETLELPIVGRFGKKTISKEELLDSWFKIARTAKLKVEEGVKVTGIEGRDDRFAVQTSKGPVYARKVVLATGRRGSPRKIGAPGEELSKVAYRLIDPEQYADCSVLVVGGGDSALEAAIQLANESSAIVTLSYRGAGFGKSRQANRDKIDALSKQCRVQVLLESEVKAILPETVELTVAGKPQTIDNDYVLACIGGELPLEFLKSCEVRLKRYAGTALGESSDGAPTAARASSARKEKERKHRRFSLALFVIGAAVIAGLWFFGESYYVLPRAARLKSPLHALLKPSGPWGHGVGIAATAVMMLNYVYALRKRWRGLKGLGDIRYWLSFHVFVGSLSPLVIAFHAAFQSNNGIASATAASMVVLVSTGLIGRFLVALVPQREGRILDLAELEQQARALKGQVMSLLASAREAMNLDAILEPVILGGSSGNLAGLAMALPRQMIGFPLRLRRIRRHFPDAHRYEDFARSVTTLGRLRIQVSFYGALRRYLSIWRVLHVGLSLFMVLLIVVHVGVSLYMGFIPHLHAH
jgi:thioredoxin reductase/NAD-dependent dihydropyrimidine dehydrogenase PreA subunit